MWRCWLFGWDFLLMLCQDSEDEMWSRFIFELLIWLQEVTLARWTQPSGPLCIWQCYCIAPMFQIGLVLNCAVFCKPQVIYQKVLDAPLDIWYQKQNRKYILLFQHISNITNMTDENLNLIPYFQCRSFEYISASLNVLIWLRPPCKSCKKLIKARQKID